MSAAIKRLSTIIRPSNSSSPPSPPKENGKNSIDAPAPAAPVDASATEASAKAEENPKDTTTDAVKDAVDIPAPEQVAAPAGPTDSVQDSPSTADSPKDKDATASATVQSKKEKEGKTSHRRDPRDIGRSTIRRFSTILRSQAKDAQKEKESVPLLPTQEAAAKAGESEAKTPEDQEGTTTEEASKDAVTKENGAAGSVSAEKTPTPSKPASETKNKTEAGKVKRRSSSFFTAAREGLQRTAKDVQTRARGQPRAAKAKAAVKAEVLPKIVKKGAAKGKRVVVITGASKGVGLQFVKQFSVQPNTFVIALSRTAEKSAALKPIVSASAKEGHNVRVIKLDISSLRSIHNAVKDIVELTEGRIDLLINAAGSRGDQVLKVWDLQGGELEDELRYNLIGPITFTNALIPYLKPMPLKEEKRQEAEKLETPDVKEEKGEEAKEEKTAENAEEKKEEMAEEKQTETVTAEAKPDIEDTSAAAEPSVQTPDATADKQEASTSEAPAEKPAEAAPAEGESTEPAAEEVPSLLPAQPFVIFLAPSDPIQNLDGAVPTGYSFAPSPRTLFSLSRAALQVAIAKYAVGLGSQNIGIVGVERFGLHDPHSVVSDEQSVAGVIKVLPDLSIRDNGKLLKTGI